MRVSRNFEPDRLFDVIIIGGGITGAGVARDAALRGLSCLLLEKGDFSSGTTSKSTRLIHGGLRYLAHFEMDLVAESLRERSILRRLAPYLIQPVPILIPIYRRDAHGRFVVSIGIHLYDLLSHEKDIPHYFTSGITRTLEFEPRLNRTGLQGSALFYDHQITMPERLVIENILSARRAGAAALNYARAERIEETANGIFVTARDLILKETRRFQCRTLVNATGPWIDRVRQAGNRETGKVIFPTKGIHLVLPKLSEQALFVNSRDGRMFFIVPFGSSYSLIGTTDTKYDGDLDEVHAEKNEIEYLLSESRTVLPGLNLTREAILYTYAGIRPLAFSGRTESKISRKHRVVREGRTGAIISIAGGKLTTYRNMAKDVVDSVCRILGLHMRCITDSEPFPGGLPAGYDEYVNESVRMFSDQYPVDGDTVRHLIRLYGARIVNILELSRDDPGLLQRISPDSHDIFAQVLYSLREEEAKTVSDIVLRRMQIGLTGSRGLSVVEKIAAVAGKEQGWDPEEMRQEVADFRESLGKDREGLIL